MKPSPQQAMTDRNLLSVWHDGYDSDHDNFDIFIATKDYCS